MRDVVWSIVILLCAGIPVHASDVPADARQAISAANTAWIPALKQEDAAAVAEPYGDGAVFVAPDGQTVVGPRGVEQMMRARFAAVRVLDGSITQDGLVMQGTLVYEWGHATLQIQKPDGSRASSAGRYLTVWKKSADGRWRIWRNLSLGD